MHDALIRSVYTQEDLSRTIRKSTDIMLDQVSQ